MLTGHVNFKLPYNQIYQMKTTLTLLSLCPVGCLSLVFKNSIGPILFSYYEENTVRMMKTILISLCQTECRVQFYIQLVYKPTLSFTLTI